MNLHRHAMICSQQTQTLTELKDLLRRTRIEYQRELHSNGLTGKLEDLSRRKEQLKTQIFKGIYLLSFYSMSHVLLWLLFP